MTYTVEAMMESEWIDCGLPYWAPSKVGESFKGKGLNRPGTLIEMEDGERYLIGDVNEIRGVCDDCTAFPNEAIVRRYRVVWSGEADVAS